MEKDFGSSTFAMEQLLLLLDKRPFLLSKSFLTSSSIVNLCNMCRDQQRKFDSCYENMHAQEDDRTWK